MRRIAPSRKAKFNAALALVGMTKTEWADSAGVTRQHVNALLREERESSKLDEKIDTFIESAGLQHVG